MNKPQVIAIKPAGNDHQVVTVTGGAGLYRRTPCGGCPWKTDNVGSFPAEAFAHSANTANDMATHTFACHESGTEKPAICAGFLLRGADHNMSVRMKISRGEIDMTQVDDGGDDLYTCYVDMAVDNGLDPDDPALSRCR